MNAVKNQVPLKRAASKSKFSLTRLLGRLIMVVAFFCTIAASAADFVVGNSGATDYVINGANDPTLTLVRGQTYTFSLNASGHPFWIKTNAMTGTTAAYNAGVTGNGTAIGTLTFAVPFSAPNSLAYICQFHSNMRGTLVITNPPPTPALLTNLSHSAAGAFQFNVIGTPGRLHFIEASIAPGGGWVALGSNATATGMFTFIDTNAASFSDRLYRVRTQ
jgi:plastocyanin